MINVWALSRQYLFAQHENNERRNKMKKKRNEKRNMNQGKSISLPALNITLYQRNSYALWSDFSSLTLCLCYYYSLSWPRWSVPFMIWVTHTHNHLRFDKSQSQPLTSSACPAVHFVFLITVCMRRAVKRIECQLLNKSIHINGHFNKCINSSEMQALCRTKKQKQNKLSYHLSIECDKLSSSHSSREHLYFIPAAILEHDIKKRKHKHRHKRTNTFLNQLKFAM